MQAHKFIVDYFHDGQVKFAAGSCYAPDDETQLAVAAGHAEQIDAEGAELAYPFGRVPEAATVPPAPAETPPPATDQGAGEQKAADDQATSSS